jgi:hypothetical protein
MAIFVGLSNAAITARADHMDDKLIEVAPGLVKSLQEKGFKNVGVLKFLVKKGNAASDGNAGALNMNMAERIENALLLGVDEAKPMGIIDNATVVAAKANPKYSVKSVETRKTLFAHKYPLAWGKEHVSADAFVTGTVDLSTDMKKATVDVGYFDKTGVIHSLKSFEVHTDRSILADSGQSFAISKRSLKKRNVEELDNDAAQSAAQADAGKPVTQQLANDGDKSALKFEILYNQKPQDISPDDSSSGEMKVATPNKGDAVAFVLTNTSSEKIAVVVKVNGVSTLENDTSEDSACLKWILEPGKKYNLRGFYAQGKVDVFKVLDDDESKALMSDGSKPKPGYIDIAVFHENQDGDPMKAGRTLRNATARTRSVQHPATLKDAKVNVQKRAVTSIHKGRKGRGLIVEGGGTEDKTLETDEMKNPTAMYNVHISYFKPSSANPSN